VLHYLAMFVELAKSLQSQGMRVSCNFTQCLWLQCAGCFTMLWLCRLSSSFACLLTCIILVCILKLLIIIMSYFSNFIYTSS